jgi:hypothetical protein
MAVPFGRGPCTLVSTPVSPSDWPGGRACGEGGGGEGGEMGEGGGEGEEEGWDGLRLCMGRYESKVSTHLIEVSMLARSDVRRSCRP